MGINSLKDLSYQKLSDLVKEISPNFHLVVPYSFTDNKDNLHNLQIYYKDLHIFTYEPPLYDPSALLITQDLKQKWKIPHKDALSFTLNRIGSFLADFPSFQENLQIGLQDKLTAFPGLYIKPAIDNNPLIKEIHIIQEYLNHEKLITITYAADSISNYIGVSLHKHPSHYHFPYPVDSSTFLRNTDVENCIEVVMTKINVFIDINTKMIQNLKESIQRHKKELNSLYKNKTIVKY